MAPGAGLDGDAERLHKPVSAAAVQGAAFEVIEADGTFTGAIIVFSLQVVRQTRAEPGLTMVSVPASAISPPSTARKRALKLQHRIVKAVSRAARPVQDDGTDGTTAGVISLALRSKASGVREHRRGAGQENKAAELEQAGAEAHAPRVPTAPAPHSSARARSGRAEERRATNRPREAAR